MNRKRRKAEQVRWARAFGVPIRVIREGLQARGAHRRMLRSRRRFFIEQFAAIEDKWAEPPQ